jgi:hypothetical protein
VGGGSVLDGFTMMGGYTMDSGHPSREQGSGGAWCERTGIVGRCTIHANHASQDGGGANGGVFHSCRFFDNVASGSGKGVDDAVLSNCVLAENGASESKCLAGVGYNTDDSGPGSLRDVIANAPLAHPVGGGGRAGRHRWIRRGQ